MITAPTQLLVLVAPWHRLYADSRTVETAVTFLHLAALLFGGGLAIAADRRTLRLDPDRGQLPLLLRELGGVHRPVVIALGVLLLSGLAMAAADLETFLGSPIFAAKLLLVALLVANGGLLLRTERALTSLVGAGGDPLPPPARRLWRRLRLTSRVSQVLWVGSVLVGTILVNAA